MERDATQAEITIITLLDAEVDSATSPEESEELQYIVHCFWQVLRKRNVDLSTLPERA